jgi:hypothetical protein
MMMVRDRRLADTRGMAVRGGWAFQWQLEQATLGKLAIPKKSTLFELYWFPSYELSLHPNIGHLRLGPIQNTGLAICKLSTPYTDASRPSASGKTNPLGRLIQRLPLSPKPTHMDHTGQIAGLGSQFSIRIAAAIV